MNNQHTDIDSLGVEQLTEIRKAAKTLFDSGVLTPHKKQHTWSVIARIDEATKALSGQDGPSD